jgi:hypothetical protein
LQFLRHISSTYLHGFAWILRHYDLELINSTSRVISNWYFPVGIGQYFLVFTIPIPKEISVSTFWHHFFGGKASPPFAEKRSSRQTSNTDQNITTSRQASTAFWVGKKIQIFTSRHYETKHRTLKFVPFT